MNNNTKKTLIIVIVILLVFTFLYILFDKLTNKEISDDKNYILKNYEINEYIPTYISDEDMAKIYLNDYIHTMYLNVEDAYNLLDEDYRNKKFGNLNNYKNYVKSLNYNTYELARYYKVSKKGYLIFGVYDTNGNFFGFKTQGVMQYTVYLDEDTVEIW